MSETSFPKVELCKSYRCCKCGTTYSTEKQAENCFDTHVSPKEIVREFHRYISDGEPGNHNNYPRDLDILFNDGEVIRYGYIRKVKN